MLNTKHGLRKKARHHRLRKKARRHRKALVEAQYNRCYWCHQEMVESTQKQDNSVTVDHIIRLADGGTSRLDNLVAACRKCNHRRNARIYSFDKTCRECGGPNLSKRRKCHFCREMDNERYHRLKAIHILGMV